MKVLTGMFKAPSGAETSNQIVSPSASRHKRRVMAASQLSWILIACGGSPLHAGTPRATNIEVYVVPAISAHKILPTDASVPGAASTTLKIVACRGEYEAASFVLRNSQSDLSNVELVRNDLVGSDGNTRIPASSVDIKVVKPWYQSFYAWNEIGKIQPDDFRQTLVPELLLNDDGLVTVDLDGQKNLVRIAAKGREDYILVNPKRLAAPSEDHISIAEFPVQDSAELLPLRVEKNSNKQIWITVHVPESVASGNYTGLIEIRESGRVINSLRLQLWVPAFDLVEGRIVHSMYYRATLATFQGTIGSEERTAGEMKQELLDMKRHGVGNPTMYQSPLDATSFRAVLKLRKDLGMNRGSLYLVGLQTTQGRDVLRRIIPSTLRIAREYGFSDVYIYGRDEAQGDALREQREVWAEVHRLGAKIFVAGYDDSFAAVGDVLDLLVHAHQPTFLESEKWHGSGRRIFNYDNPQTGPENPYLFRLNYGVLLWANGYDGAMPYAFQHCFGTCWNDVDHPTYRDHMLTYPTVDGVIDTLAWEGYREGADDTRYLETLEATIRERADARPRAATEGRQYLTALRAQVLSLQGRSGKYNQGAMFDLNRMRGNVIEHIVALVE